MSVNIEILIKMVLPTDRVALAAESIKVANSTVNNKVANILNAITKPSVAAAATATTKEPNRKQREALKKKNATPRGLAKSGRPWKEVKQK